MKGKMTSRQFDGWKLVFPRKRHSVLLSLNYIHQNDNCKKKIVACKWT